MKALVTRPREDAAELDAALTARGLEPVLEPLLAIRFVADGAGVLAPLLAGAQAVLFTSANGARAFAAASPRRDLAAFAVGDATAAAARAAGFADAASAGGDVADLAALVQRRLKPADGALVHAAASAVAGDLAGALAGPGFELRRAILYEAVPAAALSGAAQALIAAGEIAVVLFFSPRTAGLFVRLAIAAGLDGACRSVAAVALSPAVAAALEPLAWRAVHVAQTPTLASLLAATDRAVAAGAVRPPAGGSLTDDRTADQPTPAAAPPRRRAAWAWLAALLVAIAVVGSAPYWVPLVPWAPTAAPAPQLAALTARLDAAETGRRTAEARLARLEARPPPPPLDAPARPDSAALAALGQRLDALEHRGAAGDVQALTETVQRATTRLDAVEGRLGSLPAAASASDMADLARLAALADLRAAVAGSTPYQDELAAVAALGRGDAKIAAAVQALTPDAASGLPDRALLAEQFRAATAPAIRRAAAPAAAAATGTLGERALARVEALVTVRRVGNDAATASPAAAAIEHARAALDSGDLAAALAALKPLDGAAAEAARPFVALAGRRLAAEGALADLARQIGARVAAPGEGR